MSAVHKVILAMTSSGMDHFTTNIIPVNGHSFVQYVSHTMMFIFLCKQEEILDHQAAIKQHDDEKEIFYKVYTTCTYLHDTI